jgi:DNA-binding transcriptional LysR family regulator
MFVGAQRRGGRQHARSWIRRRKIALPDLVNEPWTWPAAGTVVDSLVREAFRASGVEPPPATVHAESYSMRIRLAATGRFLAVLPTSIMRFSRSPAGIKVLPVRLPTTHRRIGIINLRNRTLSPLAQPFVKTAREIARSASGRQDRSER